MSLYALISVCVALLALVAPACLHPIACQQLCSMCLGTSTVHRAILLSLLYNLLLRDPLSVTVGQWGLVSQSSAVAILAAVALVTNFAFQFQVRNAATVSDSGARPQMITLCLSVLLLGCRRWMSSQL